jgi:ADP-heptose:LPS heptosyltransferase
VVKNMKSDQRILYVATHALGDLIMSLPAINFLSNQGFRVTLLVRSNTEKDFFEHTTSLKNCNVLVINEYRKLGAIIGILLLIWKLFTSRFTAAVPQMNVNEKLFNLLLRLILVKKPKLSVSVLRKALNSSPRVGKKHKVDFNIEMASQIIGVSPISWPTPVWESRFPKSKLAPRIALAPGSGAVEAFKRWPASHYAALSRKILHLFPNADIRIYGSASEAELCKEIEKKSGGTALFAGLISVGVFYDALKASDISISSCNGASHVAAHAGATVIVINGPSNLAFTGAYCSERFEVSNKLECSPCYRPDFITGCGNPICITEVDVDAVVETVRHILK